MLITTERLTMRDLAATDAAALADMASDGSLVDVGFDADCLPQAVAYARAMREKGVSVALEYSALPAELEDRVRRGLTKRVVYIAREGNQTWGEEDDPCRT